MVPVPEDKFNSLLTQQINNDKEMHLLEKKKLAVDPSNEVLFLHMYLLCAQNRQPLVFGFACYKIGKLKIKKKMHLEQFNLTN